MFDRFIRLARARKALQDKRFEDALQLADDPLIRSTARAEQVRDEARRRLLQRAGERLAAGDLAAVRALHKRLAALAENGEVEALGRALEAEQQKDREVSDAAQKGVDEARKLMAQGQVGAAGAALAALPAGGLALEREQLGRQLAERSRRAGEQLALAATHLADGAVGLAREAFGRAAALDRDAAAAAKVRPALLRAVTESGGARIAAAVGRGDLDAAFAELRALDSEYDAEFGAGVGDDGVDGNGAAAEPALRRPLAALATATLAALRDSSDLTSAAALAEAAGQTSFAPQEPLAGLLAAIRRGAAPADAGAIEALRDAAARAGCKPLAKLAAQQAKQKAGMDAELEAARALMAQDDLDAARARLTQALAADPMHEAGRRELELVEQGIAARSDRLGEARAAARAGRLREASASALALGTNGRTGAEAQLLLTDVRARMALVDRGLDEVRATLHGKAAGSAQGVRHCLARLEELRKVQVDHTELDRVAAAVQAELAGLEGCDTAATALERGDVGAAAAALDQVLARRSDLLAPERLDARVLALADRFQRRGERALEGGDGEELALCGRMLERLAVVGSAFAPVAARWQRELASRLAAADAQVAAARQCLRERDLAEAERLLDLAAEQWAAAPSVRALQDELRGYRRQSDTIAEVAALTADRDFQGAADKIAALPPTPALLRTRIFDMKQQLAKAQGLEGAFLLRVDEGGEHLVLRGESVSIGNLRQNRADLPVLANVAGKHATIRRSMSFHGGMEDTVIAEDGEVRIGDRRVDRHRLAPGDRIAFGPALAALYERPTKRSLTVALRLLGGFQVAGTERILLMKDRGKDGRILIGSAPDAHVRVPNATGEVELFAASSGQIRVHCRQGGAIDGAPFRGDHPVDAGQVVTAEGITFVVLPWRKA